MFNLSPPDDAARRCAQDRPTAIDRHPGGEFGAALGPFLDAPADGDAGRLGRGSFW